MQFSIKNLTTLYTDYFKFLMWYHQQMLHLFHLETVIVSFYFQDIYNVLYGELGALDHWRYMC